MPIRRVVMGQLPGPTGGSPLVEPLVREWLGGSGQLEDGPDIIEDSDPNNGIVHLYVIWSRFNGVDLHERGKIILAAYERVAPDNVRNVNLTMGLTLAEAKQMGLQ